MCFPGKNLCSIFLNNKPFSCVCPLIILVCCNVSSWWTNNNNIVWFLWKFCPQRKSTFSDFEVDQHTTLVGNLLSLSEWICAVGCIGFTAQVTRNKHKDTQNPKNKNTQINIFYFFFIFSDSDREQDDSHVYSQSRDPAVSYQSSSSEGWTS